MLRTAVQSSLAALLIATALPATALAAPHWAAPRQVLAAPAAPGTLGSPQALITADGSILAFGDDGANPVVLRGTIAAGLTAEPIATTSRGTARGSVGADGTVAAVWSDNAHGHVAVAAPGAAFGAPIDLPGEGVNSLDVAVSPDGTTIVAWRTKTAPPAAVYELHVAEIPKGGALGAGQVLDTATSGIFGVHVAAGENGAVAIAYGRRATAGRTKVSVKAPGAAAFDAPQVVSSGAASDLDSRVVVERDGTIVVAIANAAAGQVALRRPGTAGFDAPAPLGAPAYGLDLQTTPQGRAALAFSAGGDVRAALQNDDGSFAPATIGPAPGNIPPQPVIAVDAGGAATVAYADASDGSVRAIVLGGATTTIGYGAPGKLTSVALAAGAAGRAVALWVDAQGALSSATYGEDAPAASGPGPAPAAPDTREPRVRLLSRGALKVTRRTSMLKLRLTCDEACRIGVSSNLRTTVKGRKRIAPVRSLDQRRAPLRKAGVQTVTITLGRAAVADLRRALRAKRGARVFLYVTAADAAGNSAVLRAAVTLKAR